MYPSSASPLLSRKVFPHASFWAGRTTAKHLSVPPTSTSASRANSMRASFLFCRNYFPGRAFCLISAPRRFLFVGTVVLSSFHERRSVPASLRKLFNSWRKYDTSESTEAFAKEHGNAFCPFLASRPSRSEHVFLRIRRSHMYCTSTIGLLRHNLRMQVYCAVKGLSVFLGSSRSR